MPEFDIKSSTVDKGLDLAKEFLQRLVGPSIDEMGLLFADNVKVWRLKNQIRNLNKVQEYVKKKEIDVKKVNLKVLFPYLESISLEDEDKLQDMWAKLFTNYIDSKKNLTLTVYPNILRQLSTNEVYLLEYIDQHSFIDIKINSNLLKSDGEVSNLERLGLVRMKLELSTYNSRMDPIGEPSISIEEVGSNEYYLTSFGYDFLIACAL